VTTASLRLAHDAVVWLDYGQFSLCGSFGGSGDYMGYLEHAIAGAGIAGDAYAVVVLSPHQNNFEMPFRVEVWDGEPPEDEADWEEIFLCGLVVDDGGLRYQSPITNTTVFDVPPGNYAVLICGRGFVNHGWPGSTRPGDAWRVRIWPSAHLPVLVPFRIKAWQQPESG
jgi:hypothetical protein